MFLHQAFPEISFIKHRQNQKVYKFTKLSNNKSELKIIILNSMDEQIGYTVLRFREHALNPGIMIFCLDEIIVNNNERGSSLGLFLIYIATREVKINGGQFLYLTHPAPNELGFYRLCGFYPDPLTAGLQQETVKNAMQGVTNPIEVFNQHFAMTKKFVMWRGNIDDINMIIYPKITQLFEAL